MSDLIVVLPPGVLAGQTDLARCELLWRDGQREGRADLQALSEISGDRSCVLVLSAADALLTSVQLARRQARHIRKVVPFLLEDQLTVPAETQWFAWGERDGDQYPVAAVDRDGLEQLLAAFREAGVHVTSVRVDGQLLAAENQARYQLGDHEIVVLDRYRVLSLPQAVVQDSLRAIGVDTAVLPAVRAQSDTLACLDAAVQAGEGAELLHGDLAPKRQKKNQQSARVPDRWRPPALVCGVLLLVGWVITGVQAWVYQQRADDAATQARALYEQLFPGDRALRLEAQFRARLESGAVGGDGFLALMGPAGEAVAALREQGVQPRRIQYDERQNALELELNAPDYETLEALQQGIRDKGLQAEIANFRNQGKVVTARMKVAS